MTPRHPAVQVWLRGENDAGGCISALEQENANLREALQLLYEETADYIRINNLGDVHHNRSMQAARDALAKAESNAL